MPEAKDAPVVEDKETKKDGEDITPPADQKPAEEKKDVTVGDALHKEDKKDPPKDARVVPESAFLELKSQNKEFKRQIENLQKQIESGATKREVSQSIKEIADKHNVDAGFLGEFAEAVRKETEADVEGRVAERLRPIEEKEKAERIDKVFNEHFDKTLEELPEYKGIVNKEVIRAMALDPKNKDKTFAQIFQESFGHLVKGKKTLDTTKPRAGKQEPEIDYDRAKKDPEYFKEIMADPDLKKEYNKNLESRIHL